VGGRVWGGVESELVPFNICFFTINAHANTRLSLACTTYCTHTTHANNVLNEIPSKISIYLSSTHVRSCSADR
jgi:hypothetical protein